jgi:hypothetical protein
MIWINEVSPGRSILEAGVVTNWSDFHENEIIRHCYPDRVRRNQRIGTIDQFERHLLMCRSLPGRSGGQSRLRHPERTRPKSPKRSWRAFPRMARLVCASDADLDRRLERGRRLFA